MNPRKAFFGICLFAAGTVVGMAMSFWYTANQWDQWFSKYNLAPLMSEQTFALKFLRRNEAEQLQHKIDETVWRNIEMYAGQKATGRPWPIDAKQEVEYHCAYLRESASKIEAAVLGRRTALCKSLLGT